MNDAAENAGTFWISSDDARWIPLLLVVGVGVGLGGLAGLAGRHGRANVAAVTTPVTADAALPAIVTIDAPVDAPPVPLATADAALFVADASAAPAAPDAASARDASATTDAAVAVVTVDVAITSVPPGVEITVAKNPPVKTPATIALPLGDVAVVARLRGYATDRRTLHVVSGASLHVVLRKVTGRPGKGSGHDQDGLMKPGDL